MAKINPRGPKPKIENPGKVLKGILGYMLKSYKFHCIAVVLCIFIGSFSTVQGTLFIQTLIDDFITPMLKAQNPDFMPLIYAIARVGCFYLLGVLAAFTRTKLMVYVTQGTLRNIRNDMFTHMETLPVRYFDKNTHGDIMSMYTNDVDTLRQMISQSVPQFIECSSNIISVLLSMIYLSPVMTLLSLVMVSIMVTITKKVSGKSSSYFISHQQSLGNLNGYVEEMMAGQKVVKVFCHEEIAENEFDELNEELFDKAYNANAFANIIGPLNAQIGNVSYVVIAIVGGMIVVNGWLGFTAGALISFLTLSKSLNMPINQISMQFNSIIMALAGGERIMKLLEEEPEVDEGYVTLVNAKKNADGTLTECEEKTHIWAWKHYHQETDTTDYIELKGDVVFDGVDFGYNPDKIVLHDVKMYATPGQKIAFVGSTGAGKTTITNLINRFYDIQDGKIRYDGININKIKKDDLRRSLGMVLQTTNLFTGTVADNIRYGKLDATDEEVVAAAKLANAHEFITKLPDGYNTVLKGDGAGLSQGQMQLLAIARAAIADPPVLILDEATSSIDTRTEKIVQEGMDKLMQGRTTFVIAHRLSTVKNSNCIMVLEQGRIIERGTHEELLAEKGKYYQLYTGNSIAK